MNNEFQLVISIIIAVIGLSVGFLIIRYSTKKSSYPEKMNQLLDESNQRLKSVKGEYYNGQEKMLC